MATRARVATSLRRCKALAPTRSASRRASSSAGCIQSTAHSASAEQMRTHSSSRPSNDEKTTRPSALAAATTRSVSSTRRRPPPALSSTFTGRLVAASTWARVGIRSPANAGPNHAPASRARARRACGPRPARCRRWCGRACRRGARSRRGPGKAARRARSCRRRARRRAETPQACSRAPCRWHRGARSRGVARRPFTPPGARLTAGRRAPTVARAMAWVAVRVELAEAAAETVAAFLVEAGAPAVLTAASDEPPPPPGRARLEAHVPAAEAPRILAALADELAAATAAAPTVAVAPVPAVDWEAVFRRHHVPTAIGARLLVAPPWDIPDAPGRHVLVIAPGMAFGTGQHPTTRACLEEIEAVVGRGGIESALDVGTGSGVLAAALARLGVPRAVARENLRQNAAEGVLLLAGGPTAVRARFTLVVANLLAQALIAEAPALVAAVADAGHLVVSGLLASQVPAVLEESRHHQVASVGD